MRAISIVPLWTLAPWLPLLACSSEPNVGIDPVSRVEPASGEPGSLPDGVAGTQQAGLGRALFPGGGTSGAAEPLSPALGPESIADCDPTPSPGAAPGGEVQTVCFFGEDELDVPAATIEQIVEVVGNDEWVHIRLTLNPDFVDNTYGDTAIGWETREGPGGAPRGPRADGPDAGAPEPPPAPGDAPRPGDAPPPRGAGPGAADAGAPEPPPPPGDAPPPPDGPGAEPPQPGEPPPPPGVDGAAGPRPPREREEPGERGQPGGGRGPGGKRGHTFRDLLGSDHAQLELLDATGATAMRFKIDYISASAEASSGFASLAVDGGEGALLEGDPAWVLAATTSLDRNLNACGLGSFTESSPATDALYTPSAEASDWDYRVSYEIWVSSAAFGDAGFGSASIENVHASPSKAPGDTVSVLPAPCPVDPDQPEVEPAPLPAVLQEIR
jgi:hypothetical protein